MGDLVSCIHQITQLPIPQLPSSSVNVPVTLPSPPSYSRFLRFSCGVRHRPVAVASVLVRRAPALPVSPAQVRAAGAAAGMTVGQALRSPQFVVLSATFFACCAMHSGPIFHTISYALACGIAPGVAAVQ